MEIIGSIKKLLVKYREIIMYVIMGGCTTLVNWVVYTPLSVTRLYDIANGMVCNAAAWLAAVIFAFVTNKLWVFESKDVSPDVVAGEAAKFFGSRIFTGIIETVCPSLLVMAGLDTGLFGVQGGAAKLTVSILIVILNYILSKLLVFRKKDRQAEKGTDKQEE